MTLLKPEDRKYLIKDICSRFHEDGILRLKIVGHFEKYTPLCHFRIAEPNQNDFIYITELFGDFDSGIEQGFFIGGARKQYHGNYNGLSKIILQGVNVGLFRPAFRIHATGAQLSKDERIDFDNSLRYIKRILEQMTPEIRHFELGNDFFSDTYYI